MFIIKNFSDEDLEIIEDVDPTVIGCRLDPDNRIIWPIKKGEQLCVTAYEPGLVYRIVPVKDKSTPRTM